MPGNRSNTKSRSVANLQKRSAGWLQQFSKDESGVLVGFALFLFLIILMIGGVGIDLIRSEMARTKMQHTLDRAILAAADMQQDLDPKVVVEEYFAKAGMSDYLTSVVVDQGLNYRTVEASAKTSINTHFMKLNGVDTLNVPASGRAEERIGGVEISMVLDVSGSMGSNSRLYNLKNAAKDFIDTLDENTEDGKLSVSIVPYATQVALPRNIFNRLNASLDGSADVDRTNVASGSPSGNDNPVAHDKFVSPVGSVVADANAHDYSHCIHFEGDDFNSTSVSPDERLKQAVHFSPWSDFDGRDDDPKKLVTSPVCPDYKDSSRHVMALQKDKTKLKNFIDSFYAKGNTSLDVGMKWGTALLDPAMQPVVDHLIDTNVVSSDFDGRPYGYSEARSLKVIVLMTDGQNTNQYYVEDGYRNGESNIWWNDQEEKYSVYVGEDEGDYDNDGNTTEPMFYWPHSNQWKDHAYGEGEYEETTTTTEWVCKSYRRNGSCKRYRKVKRTSTVVVNEPGSAEVVTYPDLWAYTSLESNVEDNYEPWMYDSEAWDDWYYDVRKYVGRTTKDARTRAICEAAKAKNIVVFTIGFEAPSGGTAVLKDCASSDAHYFDVNGLEISDAFAAIASSIAQLRLTQ